ncbi:MAG: CbtA family protein, partial [Burkholderiales bacterium]|nr:CbtA family protein [Burkholderiales bacterium]
RQGWWTLAAASAAAACAVAAGLRSPWRWLVAAALLAVPHLVGAPEIVADPLAGFEDEAQATLRELGRQFVWATTWVSLSFWLCMGLAAGWTFPRWVRPTL